MDTPIVVPGRPIHESRTAPSAGTVDGWKRAEADEQPSAVAISTVRQ